MDRDIVFTVDVCTLAEWQLSANNSSYGTVEVKLGYTSHDRNEILGFSDYLWDLGLAHCQDLPRTRIRSTW